MNARITAVLARTATWIAMAVAIVISLFPFYWMLRTAVAPADEVFVDGISLLPTGDRPL